MKGRESQSRKFLILCMMLQNFEKSYRSFHGENDKYNNRGVVMVSKKKQTKNRNEFRYTFEGTVETSRTGVSL